MRKLIVFLIVLGIILVVVDRVAVTGVQREIARQMKRSDATLKPVSVADVKLRAPRPQYAGLSNAKLTGAGVDMPSWQDAVGRYLARRTVGSRG